MKTLISTFFLLCVLSGCQQGTPPAMKDKLIRVEPPTLVHFSAARRGRDAALGDIAQGKLRLEFPGRPGPGSFDYAQIFKARYGVEIDVGGVAMKHTDYLSEYNRIMKEEIARRFGESVVSEVQAEVDVLISRCQATPQNRQACSSNAQK